MDIISPESFATNKKFNKAIVSIMQKPYWLTKKIDLSACRDMKDFLRKINLHTVCEESLCPNISECFNAGVATFMILGKQCTRSCKFCLVSKEKPLGVDINEPVRIAKAVKKLNLKYIVITSPTRDDLTDGGSQIFSDTVSEIKRLNPSKKVEILVPDFLGNINSITKIANSRADVISHNIETVPSLYKEIRPQADYRRSLNVLSLVKEINKNVFTKSGIMLGFGESKDDVIRVFKDLRSLDCDFLTIGQYLAPSLRHYQVKEYVSLEKFSFFEEKAYSLGFKKVKSSPYSRSSYLAHDFLATP